MSYPELIRLLMDRAYRDEQLARVNPKLLGGSVLADGMARQYTLEEIAIVTRAGPARLLGLSSKGHLGVGADADVTVYDKRDNVAEMFATPRYVVKGGSLVVEEGQLRRAPVGRRLLRPAGIRSRRRGGAAPPLRSVFDRVVRPLSRADAARRAHARSRADVEIRGVFIQDTFAEAFGMRAARLVITARTHKWAREAALKLTGFATSVIACKCEAGIERELAPARDARCATWRVRAVLHDGHGQPRQAADRAHRSNRSDLSDGELLRRAS